MKKYSVVALRKIEISSDKFALKNFILVYFAAESSVEQLACAVTAMPHRL